MFWSFENRVARRHDLSVYDASYLEVAARRSVPMASLDKRLQDAATASGIALLGEVDSP